MPFILSKTVVLVGMMGAGKTAVGTVVARKLGVAFHDLDREIEMAANLTVAEIFEKYGEEHFREKETQVLRRLLGEPPHILSTGGGAFLFARNRRAIGQAAVALWLQAELNLLWARVRHKATRPLLQTADPYDTLRRLHADREPVYALAPLRVRAISNYSVDDMARQVIVTLARHPDILRVEQNGRKERHER